MTASDTFHQMVRFMHLMYQFQSTKRTNLAANAERRENDAEHSFQVAMVAWYLANKLNLGLETEKLLAYALVHDLPEVYAGDIDPHYSSAEERNAKSSNEEAAMDRLTKEFPQFEEMHTALRDYHSKKDSESQFIYALDKLLCFLNIHMINDPYYVVLQLKNNVGMLDDMKATHVKVRGCPEIKKLYRYLMNVVRRKEMAQ